MANQKVALITGANKGLGLEMARQLGKQGVTVVMASRDPEKGKAAVESVRAEGIDAEFLKLDVTDSADFPAAAKFLEEKYGKLDILLNNAGMALESLAGGNQTSKTSRETLQKTFETNFFGPIALTQALLPLVRKSPAGRIVNMSSILGSNTLHADASSPIAGVKVFAYDSSKTALNAFTVHLANELKDTKIKVNSAHPGWVKTDLGTDAAPMGVVEGAKTGVDLALLPDDGPTGGYFHLGQTLPW